MSKCCCCQLYAKSKWPREVVVVFDIDQHTSNAHQRVRANTGNILLIAIEDAEREGTGASSSNVFSLFGIYIVLIDSLLFSLGEFLIRPVSADRITKMQITCTFESLQYAVAASCEFLTYRETTHSWESLQDAKCYFAQSQSGIY